ncbi:para-nitrobenzyl esterase-like [Clytia hemisphaerica]|uniref:Carboxylic ester hydrolase n=1 Tax=Clytia hemisphaerica TaxID=252671 RepID=A0A7M5V1Y0_9CNID
MKVKLQRKLLLFTILCVHITSTFAVPQNRIPDADRDYVNIDTECGPVEGKRFTENVKWHNDSVNVYEFRNIPYAKPPVGKLRWRPPVRLSDDPAQCWDGVLKYNKNVVACKQDHPFTPSVNTSEDCLVLTVRTPNLDPSSKLPVIVWIHGGGMLWGYNEMFAFHPDTEFSAYMEAVTVSINYRLNVFGFMSLKELWIENGPNKSYGNYGILDQIETLKWVKSNIKQFGGDSENVMIYGESGGGTGVYCLLCSPLANGLFQKASPQSGAPNIRTTHEVADMKYRSIIDKADCQKESPDNIVECLQNIDADDFLSLFKGTSVTPYHWKMPTNEPYNGYPVEILDPVVVTKSPDQIPVHQNTQVELLIGNCAQETGPFPHKPKPDANITTWADLQAALEPQMDTFKKGHYPHFLDQYQNDLKSPPQNITPKYVYEVMTSDALVLCTTNYVADHLSKVKGYTVSRYVMSQPPTKEIGLGLETAYHGWDSVLLFGLKFYKGETLPEEDEKLMKLFRGMYKDFLFSNFMTQFQGKTTDFWAGFTRSEQGMLTYHQNRCEMWNELGILNHSWGNLGYPASDD